MPNEVEVNTGALGGSIPAAEKSAYRIKVVKEEWFQPFSSTIEPKEAANVARMALSVASRNGRKGTTAETIKYYSKVAVTKVAVVMEVLCEYHFLVAKDSRARYWICESAFRIYGDDHPPEWAMPLSWDSRKDDNAPKPVNKAKATGWRAFMEAAAPVVPERGIVPPIKENADGERAQRVPSPRKTPKSRKSPVERAGGRLGEFSPSMEEASGMPENAGLAGDGDHIDDAFVADILGAPVPRAYVPPEPSYIPTLDEVSGGEIESGDELDDEASASISRYLSAGGLPVADAVLPAGDLTDTGSAEERRKEGNARGGKASKAKQEKDKVVGPPKLYLILDPTAPSAFTGENDRRDALEQMSEKVREYADEPWTILLSALQSAGNNQNAATKLVAAKIHELSKYVLQYVPPDKHNEWAEYLASLAEAKVDGSGKKTDFRLANATIRFIMRMMAKYHLPLQDIASSLREILEARAARDSARSNGEIEALRNENERLRAALSAR